LLSEPLGQDVVGTGGRHGQRQHQGKGRQETGGDSGSIAKMGHTRLIWNGDEIILEPMSKVLLCPRQSDSSCKQ
jgi:hypothetical protein